MNPKPPLRILQLCHDYKGPFKSVCQQYVAAFPDCEVTTVFLKGEPDKSVSETIGGHSVGYLNRSKQSLRGLKLGAIWQLSGLFKSQSYDLVIAHRYKAIYMVGILSWFYRIPVMLGVVHEHQYFRRLLRRIFISTWGRRYVIAGVSQSIRDNIATHCPALANNKRLITLPNAIDTNKETSILSRSDSRTALGIERDDCVIGSIGRLVDKKKYELLIEAFAELNRPSLKLLLIGAGPSHEALVAQAKQLGIQDQVVFAGHKTDAYQLVRAMDLFVLSSGQAEGFGVVLLEAMLGRVPILSSDAKGPAEVAEGVGAQFKCDDVDDLVAELKQFLSASNDERTSAIEAAYNRVQIRYSYQAFEAQVDKLSLIGDC